MHRICVVCEPYTAHCSYKTIANVRSVVPLWQSEFPGIFCHRQNAYYIRFASTCQRITFFDMRFGFSMCISMQTQPQFKKEFRLWQFQRPYRYDSISLCRCVFGWRALKNRLLDFLNFNGNYRSKNRIQSISKFDFRSFAFEIENGNERLFLNNFECLSEYF